MKASGDDHELDDDDNDEELAEPVEVRNERVKYGDQVRVRLYSGK
jgi:hypothetical protein